jgi:phosphoribosyl 1,2-cyclic phosphate phosphodiesterase
MKLTLLGTGDAIGTPKIGCSCPQCSRSSKTGETRLRTSLLIETVGKRILIDSSPDLRLQLLKNGSPHIDAVLWTHGHYDHYSGFGEFYRIQKIPPVYAPAPVLDYCETMFSFLSFEKHVVSCSIPFDLFGIKITFFPVMHPPAFTCGILIDTGNHRIGFTSDTNRNIPPQSQVILRGVDLLLCDALVPAGIHILKHMNYEDACALSKDLGAAEFRCIHMSHMIPWDLKNTGKDGESFIFD